MMEDLKEERLFAHHHLTTQAQSTGFEGESPFSITRWMLRLFDQFETKGTILADPESCKKLRPLLMQLHEENYAIDECIVSKPGAEEKEIEAIGMQAHRWMSKTLALEPGEKLLLPTGWGGRPGHAMYMQIERAQDNTFNILLFNAWGDEEQVTKHFEEKKKAIPLYAYQGFTVEDLFSTEDPEKMVPHIFQKLLTYKISPYWHEGSYEHKFGLKEILEAFRYGEKIIGPTGRKQAYTINKKVNPEKFTSRFMTIQRGGTCSQKTMNALLLTTLDDPKAYKGLAFDLRLNSLINYYHLHADNLDNTSNWKSGQVRYQLRFAATNMIRMIEKYYNSTSENRPKLTHEQAEELYRTVHYILERVEEAEKKALSVNPVASQGFPVKVNSKDSERIAETVKTIENYSKLNFKQIEHTAANPATIISEPSVSVAPDTLQQVLSDKLSRIKELQGMDQQRHVLAEVETLIDGIPLPQKAPDLWWRLIPVEQRQRALHSIEELLAVYFDTLNKTGRPSLPHQITNSGALYAMAHQLAALIDPSQLQYFGYRLDRDDFNGYFKKEPYAIFKDPREWQKRQELLAYFRTVSKSERSHPLFDFSKIRAANQEETIKELEFYERLAAQQPHLHQAMVDRLPLGYLEDLKENYKIPEKYLTFVPYMLDFGEGKAMTLEELRSGLSSTACSPLKTLGMEHLATLKQVALLNSFFMGMGKQGKESVPLGVKLELQIERGEKSGTFVAYNGLYSNKKISDELSREAIPPETMHRWNEENLHYPFLRYLNHNKLTGGIPDQNLHYLRNVNDTYKKILGAVCEPRLLVPTLLAQLKSEISFLEGEENRILVEQLLFKSLERQGNDPESLPLFDDLKAREGITLEHFRRFIDAGLKSYLYLAANASPKIEPTLFLLDLANRINQAVYELHGRAIDPPLISERDFQTLQEVLEKNAPVDTQNLARLNLYRIHDLLLRTEKGKSPEDLKQLYLWWTHVQSQIGSGDPFFVDPALRNYISKRMIALEPEIAAAARERGFRNELCNYVLKGMLQESDLPDLRWKRHFVEGEGHRSTLTFIAKSGKRTWILNLSNGRGSTEEGILMVGDAPRHSPGFSRLFGGRPHHLIIRGTTTYFKDQVHGKVRVINSDYNKGIQRKINGEWTQYINELDLRKELEPFHVPKVLFTDYNHWITGKDPRRMYFTDTATGEVRYLYDKSGLREVLPGMNPSGQTIEGLESDDEAKMLQDFELFSQIIVKKRNNDREVIELPRYRDINGGTLSFFRQGSHWVYAQDPNYRLADASVFSPLGNTRAYLPLVHMKTGQERVLVPNGRYWSKGFYTGALFQSPPADIMYTAQNKTLTYHEFKILNGTVTAGTPEGNIQLANIFLAQKDYIRALNYLHKVTKSDTLTAELKLQLENLLRSSSWMEDYSPDAAAIHLHTWLLLKALQPLRSDLKHLRVGFFATSEGEIDTIYRVYLAALKSVATPLLLSPDMEIDLLTAMNKPEFSHRLQFLMLGSYPNQETEEETTPAKPRERIPERMPKHTFITEMEHTVDPSKYLPPAKKKSELGEPESIDLKIDPEILPEDEKPYAELINKELEDCAQEIKIGRKRLIAEQARPLDEKKAVQLLEEVRKKIKIAQKDIGITEALILQGLSIERMDSTAQLPEALKRVGRRETLPTIQELIRASISKNTGSYQRLCPHLSEMQIRAMHQDLVNLMVLKTSLDQLIRIEEPLNTWGALLQEKEELASKRLELIDEIAGKKPKTWLRSLPGLFKKKAARDRPAELVQVKLREAEISKELKIQLDNASRMVAQQRQYQVEDDLPALYFEYTTGYRVSGDQAKILTKVTHAILDKNPDEEIGLVFQLIMGGGKTSVILSKFMEMVSEKGMLPIFVAHHSQYTSVKGTFKMLQAERYGKNVIPIECSSTDLKDVKILKQILKTLQDALKNKDGILMSSTTLETIQLELVMQLKTLNEGSLGVSLDLFTERVELLQQINTFILDHGLQLADEVDLLLNIMQTVNIPFGEKTGVKAERLSLVSALYGIMVREPLAGLIQLENNAQKNLSKDVYAAEVLPILAKTIAETFEPLKLQGKERIIRGFVQFAAGKIPPEYEDAVLKNSPLDVSKLSASEMEKLEFLRFFHTGLDRGDPSQAEAANLIALSAHLLQKVIPSTLSKEGNRAYGRAHDGTGRIVPYLGVDAPAETEFGYIYELLCYHFQTAITGKVERSTLLHFAKLTSDIANHYVERGEHFEETAEAREFEAFTGVPLVKIDQEGNIDKALEKINGSIEKRLAFEEMLAHNIARFNSAYLSATPISLVDQTRKVVACSGTIHNMLTYNQKFTEFLPDKGAEGKILAEFLSKGAKKELPVNAVDSDQLTPFLESLLGPIPPEKAHALLEGGGLLKKYSSIEVAHGILDYYKHKGQADKIKGVIFLHRFPNPEKPGEVKESFALLTRNNAQPIPLANTSADELTKLGFNLKELFIYYDELRTTGTDIRLPADTVAPGTVDPGKPMRNLSQMILRLRQFFGEQDVNIYISTQSKELFVGNGATLENIIQTVAKASALEKANHTLRSFRSQINNVYRTAIFREILRVPSGNAVNLVKLFERFLISTFEDSPYALHGRIPRKQTALEQLAGDAKEKAELFASLQRSNPDLLGSKTFNTMMQTIQDRVDGLLAKARTLKELDVDVLTTPTEDALGLEMNVQMASDVQEQVETELSQDLQVELETYQSLLDPKEAPFLEIPWSEASLDDMDVRTFTPRIFSVAAWLAKGWGYKKYPMDYSSCFPPYIKATQNFTQTCNKPLPIFHKAQKTAENLLIRYHPDGQVECVLLSQKDALFFKNLKTMPKNSWVVSIDGSLIASNGDPLPSRSDNSFYQQWDNILTYVNLLNGDAGALDKTPLLTQQMLQTGNSEIMLRFLALKVHAGGNQRQQRILATSKVLQTRQTVATPAFALCGLRRKEEDEFLSRLDQLGVADVETIRPTAVHLLPPELVVALRDPVQLNQLTLNQINHLAPEQLELLDAKVIARITHKATIRRIPPSRINDISINAVPYISSRQVKHLAKPDLLDNISNRHFKRLKNNQIVMLTSPRLTSRIPDALINSLSPKAIQNLDRRQLPLVHNPDLVPSIPLAHVNIASQNAIPHLTYRQLHALTHPDLVRMVPTELVKFLSPHVVNGINPECAPALQLDQLPGLTNPEVIKKLDWSKARHLNPTQLGLLAETPLPPDLYKYLSEEQLHIFMSDEPQPKALRPLRDRIFTEVNSEQAKVLQEITSAAKLKEMGLYYDYSSGTDFNVYHYSSLVYSLNNTPDDELASIFNSGSSKSFYSGVGHGFVALKKLSKMPSEFQKLQLCNDLHLRLDSCHLHDVPMPKGTTWLVLYECVMDDNSFAFLQDLKNLHILDIVGTSKAGEPNPFPSAILACKNLQRILLRTNMIQDIPLDLMEVLPELEMIDIRDNPLKDIPLAMFSSPKLRELNLGSRSIIKGKDQTLVAPNLRLLEVGRIEDGFPDLSACNQLKSLRATCAFDNPIDPEFLPASLNELDLSGLQHFPDLSKCTELKKLTLSGTFNGPIDPEFLPSSLNELVLSGLQEFPDLSKCTQLKSLKLSGAFQSPTDPTFVPASVEELSLEGSKDFPNLSTCTQLSQLKLKSCTFHSTVDPNFVPPHLNDLSIDVFKLKAPHVLDALGNLSELRKLELSRSEGKYKIDAVPYWLLKLENLTECSLHANEIGYIPYGFSQLKNLMKLDLTSNPIVDLSNLDNDQLYQLDLNACDLEQLPFFPPQKSMHIINLANNKLKVLPQFLFDSPALFRVYAAVNQITEIPTLSIKRFDLQLNLTHNKIAKVPEMRNYDFSQITLYGNPLLNRVNAEGKKEFLEQITFHGKYQTWVADGTGTYQGRVYSYSTDEMPKDKPVLYTAKAMKARLNLIHKSEAEIDAFNEENPFHVENLNAGVVPKAERSSQNVSESVKIEKVPLQRQQKLDKQLEKACADPFVPTSQIERLVKKGAHVTPTKFLETIQHVRQFDSGAMQMAKLQKLREALDTLKESMQAVEPLDIEAAKRLNLEENTLTEALEWQKVDSTAQEAFSAAEQKLAEARELLRKMRQGEAVDIHKIPRSVVRDAIALCRDMGKPEMVGEILLRQAGRSGNTPYDTAISGFFLDKAWLHLTVEEKMRISSLYNFNAPRSGAMLARTLRQSCAAGLHEGISPQTRELLPRMQKTIDNAVSFAVANADENVVHLASDVIGQIETAAIGDPLVIPIATHSHQMLLQVLKQPDGRFQLKYYNTGYGLGHHHNLPGTRRHQCFIQFDNVPLKSLLDHKAWSKILEIPRTSRESVAEKYSIFKTNLAKGGKEAPPSKDPLDYALEQEQGTCAFLSWTRWLRDQIISANPQDRAEGYLSFRLLKTNLFQTLWKQGTEGISKLDEKVAGLARKKLEKNLTLFDLYKIAKDDTAFDKHRKELLDYLEIEPEGKKLEQMPCTSPSARFAFLLEAHRTLLHFMISHGDNLLPSEKPDPEKPEFQRPYLLIEERSFFLNRTASFLQDAYDAKDWDMLAYELGKHVSDPRTSAAGMKLAKKFLKLPGDLTGEERKKAAALLSHGFVWIMCYYKRTDLLLKLAHDLDQLPDAKEIAASITNNLIRFGWPTIMDRLKECDATGKINLIDKLLTSLKNQVYIQDKLSQLKNILLELDPDRKTEELLVAIDQFQKK